MSNDENKTARMYEALIVGLGGRSAMDFPNKFITGPFIFDLEGAPISGSQSFVAASVAYGYGSQFTRDPGMRQIFGSASSPKTQLHIEAMSLVYTLDPEATDANKAVARKAIRSSYLQWQSGKEIRKVSVAHMSTILDATAVADATASAAVRASVRAPAPWWKLSSPWSVDMQTDQLDLVTGFSASAIESLSVRFQGFAYDNSISPDKIERFTPEQLMQASIDVSRVLPGPF